MRARRGRDDRSHLGSEVRSSHDGGAMIELLVPASACAEMFSDVPDSTMFSIEAAVVRVAVAERRREFGTVRYCARKALQQIGVPAVPVLPDVDGAPRWPVGVVGSMTHCAGYRAAVVARSRDLCGVGIAAEPHSVVPQAALDATLRDEERARLSALAVVRPRLHWDRILFCVKQAVFKAWFPLTRRRLDFADVSVMAHLDGTFRAHLRARGPRVAGVELDGFDGRWLVGRGLVVAAISVGRRQAEQIDIYARSVLLGGDPRDPRVAEERVGGDDLERGRHMVRIRMNASGRSDAKPAMDSNPSRPSVPIDVGRRGE